MPIYVELIREIKVGAPPFAPEQLIFPLVKLMVRGAKVELLLRTGALYLNSPCKMGLQISFVIYIFESN